MIVPTNYYNSYFQIQVLTIYDPICFDCEKNLYLGYSSNSSFVFSNLNRKGYQTFFMLINNQINFNNKKVIFVTPLLY